MAVHAHPDDESSSTGGVLARSAAEGVDTVVVTCTNGELGDGPGHVKPDEEGHDAAEVAATRLVELKTACAELGVAHLELLGYHDSGMPDWRHKDDLADAFCNVPIEESAGRLAELFERYRPDVVITYDDNGGYNHPDHLQAHRITVAAADRTGLPTKLYFTARRRRDWERMREIMEAQGIELPQQLRRQEMDPERRREMEARMAEMEARITTEIDTSAYAARKRAALAAHASQLDQSWWVQMPPEAFDGIFATETFIRARDTTGAPLPETDLFAGLR
jgi:LmbE family N-acetylglucosaminyl deacetylase